MCVSESTVLKEYKRLHLCIIINDFAVVVVVVVFAVQTFIYFILAILELFIKWTYVLNLISKTVYFV